MRAARHHGQKDIRIDDNPEPEVGPGQVGIDVALVGGARPIGLLTSAR